jgi:mono/diheme cytochrome c family protein
MHKSRLRMSTASSIVGGASAPIPNSRLKPLPQARWLTTAIAAVMLAACSGGTDVTQNPNIGGPGTSTYDGPPPRTADIQSFMAALWVNVRPDNRCGACHEAGGQSPMFAREDDVNLAYDAANTVVNLSDPNSSQMVLKVAGGHHCWLGSNSASLQACADIVSTWIENWANAAGTAGARQIDIEAPPIKDVGASRSFPADPSLYASTVYPIVEQYCAGCHSSTAVVPQQPFFADHDIPTAYDAAKPKIDLDDPDNSRLVVRLRDEFHNCWSDCADNAAEMQAAIEAFQAQVPPTSVDPSLVISKALTLYDGTVASGGNRFEASQIALWEFKEGQGTTAFDTSGVSPAINLTLSGDVTWVGGWGIDIKSGKAQGSTLTSKKLRDLIGATGEYSIEAWVAPGNVTQEDARIVSYSAGTTVRNFTLGQTMYNYDFFNRNSNSDGNGDPRLSTADADEDLQATLQHVVVTYDQLNGRRIYVNGQFTEDADTVAPGNLNDWDDTFALVLGNEVSGDRQWKGVLRLVAIHNRALTEAQIQQNQAVGVGEKFFLLFSVAGLLNVPDSYIMFEVSQFDSYGYLFQKPMFIVLSDTPPVLNVPIKGMRIGVNGVEAPVGQAYVNLDTTIGASGQTLHTVGAVIPLNLGPDGDEFFLSFEVLGTQTNVRTEPAPLTPPPPPDGAPRPDVGVRVFDEINVAMSQITGVSTQNAAVEQTFETVKQQLPTVESIDGFLSAHQVAIAQLGIEYCNALVEDNALRASFFPGFNFAQPAATAFNPAGRDLILNPLLAKALNSDPAAGNGNMTSQPTPAEVKAELNSLIDKLTACGGGCAPDRTEVVVKATCAAVLGGAGMLVQ